MRRLRALLSLLALVASAPPAGADAIVRTQAMLATTIAEYFVDEGAVRVELEIGLGDLPAFANLLPEALLREMGEEPAPLRERLARFFAHDLVVTADGAALPGRVVAMQPRQRVVRDAITGEPLPPPEEGEPEVVVFARLEYPFEGRPERIALLGNRSGKPASIGFVAYHGAVAVNDFRYLTPAQTLVLDWDDPFYTRFETRALRRQYFAPMSGFLYVDPYEVRKEIIVRALDLQQWVDLGLAGEAVIAPDAQADLKRRAAGFLSEHFPVEIDGVPVQGDLVRINFLERTLRTSRVIDPPEPLDVHAAVLGAIWVFPTEGLPQRVTLDWDLWSERAPRIPAASVDQAGPLPIYLEPDSRLLVWQNFLTDPELPTLAVLQAPPGPLRRALASWGRWLLLLAALGLGARALRVRSGGAFVAAGAALVLAAGGFGWGHGARLSEERAAEIVGGLLHNVYRAFDFRDEEKIYDVLARSAEGDLLERIYLETRRGLELQSQGGARARVKTVELDSLEAERAPGGAFDAATTWQVAGSVGHWGHVHERRNRYRARLRVAPVDGAWKLVDLEVLEEERL